MNNFVHIKIVTIDAAEFSYTRLNTTAQQFMEGRQLNRYSISDAYPYNSKDRLQYTFTIRAWKDTEFCSLANKIVGSKTDE